MNPYLHFSRSLLRRTLVPTFLITILLAAVCAPAQTPRISWAEQLSSTALDTALLINAAVDRQGNVFFTGVFSDTTVTFGSETLTNLSSKPPVYGIGDFLNENGFVAKYDSSGKLLWIQHIGGDQNDELGGCAADAGGNVYVSGWLGSSNVWFGTNLVVNAGGAAAFFLARFDPQGNLIWVRQGTGFVDSTSVGVDGAGNVHLGGNLAGANITFGTNVLSNPYYNTMNNPYAADFVAEYTSAGDVVWARVVNMNCYEAGPAFAVDTQGNSYVSDSFYGTADFGGLSLTNSGGAEGSTVFLAKYDSAGNLVWANPVATSSSVLYVRALAVGPQGDSHILGRYGPDATFGTVALPTSDNDGNGFLAKFDSTGTLTWVNPILVNPSSGAVVGTSLIVDPMDACWAIGRIWSSSATFGGIAVINSDTSANYQGFVARYQPGGTPIWAKLLDPTGVDVSPVGALDSTGSLSLYGLADGTNPLILDGNVVNGPTDGNNYFFAAKINGPTLSIQSVGTQLVISWPTNAVGLSLESITDLSSGNWSPVTNAPVIIGDQFSVTNDVSIGSRLYRLRNF